VQVSVGRFGSPNNREEFGRVGCEFPEPRFLVLRHRLLIDIHFTAEKF
jgi:hypothetical protein